MSGLDRFIARVTTGLPRGERIETAAELRSALLEGVERLQLQGFSREEAERVAVRKMGAPAQLNRGYLGPRFTARAGWWVFATLLTLLAGWTLSDGVLRPLRIEQHPSTDLAVDLLLRDSSRFLVTLPRTAATVFIGVHHPWGGGVEQLRLGDRAADFGLLRPQLEIVPGVLETADPRCSATPEAALSLLILAGRRGGALQQRATCSPAPAAPSPHTIGSWQAVEDLVATDTWLPVAVFVPAGVRRAPAGRGERPTPERLAPETTWLVLSLWVGRFAEPDLDTPPPGIAELRDRHPGVFLPLDEQEGRR